jgi:hypothetical protein
MRGARMLFLVAALAGTVVGQQSSSAGTARTAAAAGVVIQGGGGPGGGPGGGGRVDALESVCEGKKAGDDCLASMGPNRTLEGECFNGAPPGETEHVPPLHCRISHPGETACKKKKENDECEYSRLGDPSNQKTSKGKCSKTPHGSLMCQDHVEPGMFADGGPGAHFQLDDSGILPPHLACKNLTVGDECKTHGPSNKGLCLALPGTDVVHCRSLMPSEQACVGKAADAECEYDRMGPGARGPGESSSTADSKEKGTCFSPGRHESELLTCRSADRGAGHSRLSSLSAEEQKQLQENQNRIQEIRQTPDFRHNKTLADEYEQLRAAVRKFHGVPDGPTHSLRGTSSGDEKP